MLHGSNDLDGQTDERRGAFTLVPSRECQARNEGKALPRDQWVARRVASRRIRFSLVPGRLVAGTRLAIHGSNQCHGGCQTTRSMTVMPQATIASRRDITARFFI